MLNSIKRLLTYRAPNYINYPLAALCFIFAGYLIWRDFIQEKGPTPPIVDPVFYADGSVEYTLINRPNKNLKNPTKLSKWVLRFNDLIECRKVGSHGVCENYKSKVILPRFRKDPTRAVMYWNLTVRDFSFVGYLDNEEENFLKETMWVSPSERFEPLFKKRPEGYTKYLTGLNKRQSLEEGFGRLGGWNPCKVAKKLTQKFHILRQPTSQEIIEESYRALGSAGSQSVNDCRYVRHDNKRFNKDGFRLVRDDGRQIAIGDCSKFNPNKQKKTTSCSFRVWLPYERLVSVKFDRQHVAKFPEIYENLVQFFKDATVVEKSENLNWKAN